jgi:hypothetical protein
MLAVLLSFNGLLGALLVYVPHRLDVRGIGAHSSLSIKYHDFPTAQFVFNFSKIIIFSNFFCRSIQRKEIACYIRD